MKLKKANIIKIGQSKKALEVETKDKAHWHNLIQLLPSSYQQMRTVTMNYEVLINMYYARRTHKLDEWKTFCQMIEMLPYAKELILVKGE